MSWTAHPPRVSSAHAGGQVGRRSRVAEQDPPAAINLDDQARGDCGHVHFHEPRAGDPSIAPRDRGDFSNDMARA